MILILAAALALGVCPQDDPVPVVFNATQSARPGDLVSFQGENFGPNPEVWLDVLFGVASKLPLENSVGSGWVAVRIPDDARGRLTARIKNGATFGPRINLNQAIPLHLDTLQIASGGVFRIFGRNLLLPGSKPVVKLNDQAVDLKLGESDETMLVAVAPPGLLQGSAVTLTVDNGNFSGPVRLDRPVDAVPGDGSDPYDTGVGWTVSLPPPNLFNVRPEAAGDGDKDDSAAIQDAIDKAAAHGGGGAVQLPEGTFRITRPPDSEVPRDS